MSSFPNTSYDLKQEKQQHHLSLLENEEDDERIPFQEKTKRVRIVTESDGKETVHFQRGDIIAPAWKPKIPPPASHPPQEPRRPFWNLFNFFVSLVLTLIFYSCLPILLTIYMILGLIPRFLVKLLLRFIGGGKLQLMPIPRVYGSVDGNNHTVMLICRGRCDIEKIRAYLLAVINATDVITGLGKFSHLKKRVAKKFGYLCMENRKATFDIKNHVRHFDIRYKHVALNVDEIIPYLESTYVQPFDNYLTAPQWELLVVPKYTMRKKDHDMFYQHGKKMYALIFRFQNGILDWNKLQELIGEFLGKTNGRVKSVFCPTTKNVDFWTKLKMAITIPLVGPAAFIRNIFRGPSEFVEGMKPVSEEEKISFATTKSISSEAIEDIHQRTHTGIGSVLGTCVRIAVRNMALGQNVDFPNSLSVTRIFNSMNNKLPGVDRFSANFQKYRSCLERLHTSFHAIEKKQVSLSGQRTFNRILIQLVGAFPSKLSGWLYKTLMKADAIVEIWPATDEPCKLFDTDILEDIIGWSGATGTDANFKITVTSYCGRIRANVIGKLGKLSGGLTDAQTIANEFEVEYEHLASLVNLYPQQIYMYPAIADSSRMYIS